MAKSIANQTNNAKNAGRAGPGKIRAGLSNSESGSGSEKRKAEEQGLTGTAKLEIDCRGESEAEAATEALGGAEFKGERTRSRVVQQGSKVLISIEAKDSIALRALVNSYLRHIQIIEQLDSTERRNEEDE